MPTMPKSTRELTEIQIVGLLKAAFTASSSPRLIRSRRCDFATEKMGLETAPRGTECTKTTAVGP